MTRAEYAAIRRGYRVARRADGQWFQDNKHKKVLLPSPQLANRYCQQFPTALVSTFFRPIKLGSYRLPRGPRANVLYASEPVNGRFARMNLPKRVALRAALKQMAAINAERTPPLPDAAANCALREGLNTAFDAIFGDKAA